MAKWIEPDPYPTAASVGAATIITVPIPAEYRGRRIERIMIVPVAGSATSSAPVVSEDSAVSDRAKQIGDWSGCTAAAPVDDDNGGQGFGWANGENIYVKPTPDAGSDNQYKIRLLLGRHA